jgi:Family of unknown function (DUF5670)
MNTDGKRMPPDYPHTSATLREAFQYALSGRFARKSRKQKRHDRCSMEGDCFCTNETWERGRQKEEETMLWTIFVILLVLWLLGVVSGYAIGGFIHILLVIALVVLLINIIGGRRTVV